MKTAANWRSKRCSPACWRTHQKSTLLLLLGQKGKVTWESKCVCIGRVTNFLQCTGVHIYSLNWLAWQVKSKLKKILRYTDSNFLYVESFSIKPPPEPSSVIRMHAGDLIEYNIPTSNRHANNLTISLLFLLHTWTYLSHGASLFWRVHINRLVIFYSLISSCLTNHTKLIVLLYVKLLLFYLPH